MLNTRLTFDSGAGKRELCEKKGDIQGELLGEVTAEVLFGEVPPRNLTVKVEVCKILVPTFYVNISQKV